jgi:hypothetical protein
MLFREWWIGRTSEGREHNLFVFRFLESNYGMWMAAWLTGSLGGSLDGQMDGWTIGWMDRWIDGWMMDGWMDGRKEIKGDFISDVL